MKDLHVNEEMTLNPPDSDGDVNIEFTASFSGTFSNYVSFEVLEEWVASVREQIITVSTDAEVWECKECGTVSEITRDVCFRCNTHRRT